MVPIPCSNSEVLEIVVAASTKEQREMGLSVGMITWNEARRIEPTLEAVRGWPDEIVVIDSGSTDGTQEICRRLGARVIDGD
jgi:glycosyltransferase involved in cell wall biosynthesis